MSPSANIASREEEIEKHAEQSLDQLEKRTMPTDLLGIAKNAGIDVRVASFRPSKRDTIVMLSKTREKPSIHLRETSSALLKREALAHALGHYFLHFANEAEFIHFDKASEIIGFKRAAVHEEEPERLREEEARLFGAALLMPKRDILLRWAQLQSVCDMAEFFQVSEEAMYDRLSRLELL